jgi:hypothetical protein
VPVFYAWVDNPPPDGSMPNLYANVLIGYTPPRASIVNLDLLPFVDTPQGSGTGQNYHHLGAIIERRFPLSGQPRLLASAPAYGALSNVVPAVSFLADFSKAQRRVFQRNSADMDLTQRQQCLYWDGPKRVGSQRFPPSADSTVAPANDPTRVVNYQITKAFRIGYEYTELGTIYRGDILIGYNGSGDG